METSPQDVELPGQLSETPQTSKSRRLYSGQSTNFDGPGTWGLPKDPVAQFMSTEFYISFKTAQAWVDAEESETNKPREPRPALDRHAALKAILGRDVAFLVDDSLTMLLHWHDLVQTFRVLIFIISRYNKGRAIAVYFTNSEEVFVSGNPRDLAQVLQRHHLAGRTNMNASLKKVSDRCNVPASEPSKLSEVTSRTVKGKSIYILTDAAWMGGLNTCSEIERISTNNLAIRRPASLGIQFVLFGETEQFQAHLENLDSRLFGMGIVDAEHCRGNVFKMLMGSFHGLFRGRLESYEPKSDQTPAATATLTQNEQREIRKLESHKNRATTVGLSTDGQFVFSASNAGTVTRWTVSTGRGFPIHHHQHAGWPSATAFSPDGLLFASASFDKVIRIGKTSKRGQYLRLQGHRARIDVLRFSVDGKILVSASWNGELWTWDTTAGKVIKKLTMQGSPIVDIVLSPDGRMLASAGYDKTIQLLDAQTGKETQILTGHKDMLNAVAFSPNGQILASASDDKTIQLWNLKTDRARITLKGHSGAVNALAFSPNGQTLASASSDKTVRLWNIAKDQEIDQFQGHTKSINDVVFSSDGKILASASNDRSIRLWDVSAYRQAIQVKQEQPPTTGRVLPDSAFTAATTQTEKEPDQGCDDTSSVYSNDDDHGIPQDLGKQLEREFAAGILRDFRTRFNSTISSKHLLMTAGLALRTYAILAMLRANNEEHRRAAIFVRQSRNRIVREIQSLLEMSEIRRGHSGSEEELPRHINEPSMPVSEKLARWLVDLQIAEDPRPSNMPLKTERLNPKPVVNANDTDQSSEDEPFAEDYLWLLAQIEFGISYKHEDSGQTMTRVRDIIMDALIHPRTCQKQNAAIFIHLPDWELQEFMAFEYQHIQEPVLLSNVITVAGSESKAYATTCGDYVRQVWPTFGRRIIWQLQSAISGVDAHAALLKDNNTLQVEFYKSNTGIFASGSTIYCMEVAEVISWISTVCRRSTYTNICTAFPVLESWDNDIPCLAIRHYIKEPEHARRDTCWHTMFRNPIIADNYPIPARHYDEKGLEATLTLIAALAQTLFATTFRSKFLLKGFNSILTPVLCMSNSTQWHYVVDTSGERLPYSAGWPYSNFGSEGSTFSEHHRHFVGWTPEVRSLFGSPSAVYQDIRWSHVPEVSKSIRVEQDLNITAGKYITAALKVVRGYKDMPVHSQNGLPYHDQLHVSSSWNVILSDAAVRKHWLCDGTSAILHLCRAWICENLGDMADKIHITLPDDVYQPDAAFVTLSDKKNSHLMLRNDWEKLSLPTSLIDASVGSLAESVPSPFGLDSLVQRFWNTLEQMLDSAFERRHATGLTLGGFEQSIIGYEFKDVVKGTRVIEPHQFELEAGGRNWLQLSQKLYTINLFGGKFGELLQPLNNNNLSSVRQCNWRTLMPKDCDYLGAPLSVFKTSAERHAQVAESLQICSGLYWQNLEESFKSCECAQGCAPSRACLPNVIRLSSCTTKPDKKAILEEKHHPIFEKYPRGAVIIGHENRHLTKAKSSKGARNPKASINEQHEQTEQANGSQTSELPSQNRSSTKLTLQSSQTPTSTTGDTTETRLATMDKITIREKLPGSVRRFWTKATKANNFLNMKISQH